MDTTARQEYWRRNLRLKAALLAIWFVVSYGCGILLVDQLNEISLGDFKLGFWFAQQGSIYVFVALIGVYAWRMDQLDRTLGVDEDNGPGSGAGPGDAGAGDAGAGGAGAAGAPPADAADAGGTDPEEGS